MPVYTAVTLLLACGGQLSSILESGGVVPMSRAVGKGLQPHKISLTVYILHFLLRYTSLVPKWFPFQRPIVILRAFLCPKVLKNSQYSGTSAYQRLYM